LWLSVVDEVERLSRDRNTHAHSQKTAWMHMEKMFIRLFRDMLSMNAIRRQDTELVVNVDFAGLQIPAGEHFAILRQRRIYRHIQNSKGE